MRAFLREGGGGGIRQDTYKQKGEEGEWEVNEGEGKERSRLQQRIQLQPETPLFVWGGWGRVGLSASRESSERRGVKITL